MTRLTSRPKPQYKRGRKLATPGTVRSIVNADLASIQWWADKAEADSDLLKSEKDWEPRSWAYDLPGIHDGPELSRGLGQVRDRHGVPALQEPYTSHAEDALEFIDNWMEIRAQLEEAQRKANPLPKLKNLIMCEVCGKGFEKQHKVGRPNKFCTEECRRKRNYQHTKNHRAKKAEIKRQQRAAAERFQARQEAQEAAATPEVDATLGASVHCPPEAVEGPQWTCPWCDEQQDEQGNYCETPMGHESCIQHFHDTFRIPRSRKNRT